MCRTHASRAVSVVEERRRTLRTRNASVASSRERFLTVRTDDAIVPADVDSGAGKPIERAQNIQRAAERDLLQRLHERRSDIVALFDKVSSHWGFEDPVYRFYHQSYKVFHRQRDTATVVELLGSLAPGRPLNAWFRQIVLEGTYSTLTEPPIPMPSGYAALLYLYDLR
jgi:hypothetical protein